MKKSRFDVQLICMQATYPIIIKVLKLSNYSSDLVNRITVTDY